MEPTIYKPGLHNSPGIYKGAGGIYKGRGVYNNGEQINNALIYESDFSNFDVDTQIDYPIIGTPTQWSASNFQKTTRNINGIEKPCIHLNNNGLLTLDIYLDYDVLSVEYITNKDSYQGIGAGSYIKVGSTVRTCPFYNCYGTGRGVGCNHFNTPENGFYLTSWGAICPNDATERTDVTQLSVGGVTIDKINEKAKAFLHGKKAATITENDFSLGYTRFRCYTDNGGDTQMNIFGIKIYKNVDIYEQME